MVMVRKKKAAEQVETTIAAAVKPEALTPELVTIDAIRPSPSNPRDFTGRAKEIEELARNIGEVGLLEPIIVRPVGKAKGNDGASYEIVAGERRWRACRLIWTEIPSFVRKLTDEEAFEITVVENLQREDLSPVEEAKGIQALIDHGRDVRTIADHLGKPLSWVIKRARLSTLSEKWKKAVADPESGYHHWTATHLELIARFERTIQDELFNAYNDESLITVAQLQKSLDQYQLLLRSAPWKLDAEYDTLPTCKECNKRASIQPALFDEETIPADKDRCLDINCWNRKQIAFIERREAELRHDYPNLELFDAASWNNRTLPADHALKKKKHHNYIPYGYKKAKKATNGAVPVLTIDGNGVGEITWYTKDRDGSSSNGRQGNYDADGNKFPTPLAERRKMLQGKRDKELIARIKAVLDTDINDGASPKKFPDTGDYRNVIMALALAVMKTRLEYLSEKEFWKEYNMQFDLLADGGIEAVLGMFYRRSYRNDIEGTIGGQLNNTLDRIDSSFARRMAELHGIDVAALEAEIKEQIREPKAWARLNEDGAPKKAKDTVARTLGYPDESQEGLFDDYEEEEIHFGRVSG
jgi:ParB/RepB/Spo0J family partition protein